MSNETDGIVCDIDIEKGKVTAINGESFDDKRKDAIDVYAEVIKKCPILYGQYNLPMTQTCMCWGIECGSGWRDPINELSVHLEAINIDVGKKYGFAVEAVQVKEKYGTLRFYTKINPDKFFDFSKILAWPFWILHRITNSRKMLDIAHNIMQNYRKNSKWRKERRIFIEWIDNIVRQLIDRAETQCLNHCEICGQEIGGYTPRCEMDGWIQYVCSDCAANLKHGYIVVSPYKVDGEDVEGKHFAAGEYISPTEESPEVPNNEEK